MNGLRGRVTQIFPEWTNNLPKIVIFGIILIAFAIVGFFWYFGSPKYTDVGYRPLQPVAYSHKLHPGDLGIDCRYCHYDVEYSAVANIPPTQVCMNCHKIIGTDNTKLLPVRESFSSGIPIKWVRVHKLPDYVYFNHSIHLYAGVGCSTCHGNVAQMDVVQQMEPLSMSWCLDCHRNPDMFLRPHDQITNMDWTPPENQLELAATLKER